MLLAAAASRPCLPKPICSPPARKRKSSWDVSYSERESATANGIVHNHELHFMEKGRPRYGARGGTSETSRNMWVDRVVSLHQEAPKCHCFLLSGIQNIFWFSLPEIYFPSQPAGQYSLALSHRSFPPLLPTIPLSVTGHYCIFNICSFILGFSHAAFQSLQNLPEVVDTGSRISGIAGSACKH